jgi:hypothetical protein
MSLRAPLAVLIATLLSSPLLAGPLRFLPWDEAIAARKLAVGAGREAVDLTDLHPLKRSKPVQVAATAESPAVLIAKDKTSPDGKPVTVVIKIPAECQSPLVIIVPDPKDPTGVKPFVVEDNTARFPYGTFRHLNATGKELVTKLGEKTVVLPPKWDPVDVDPGGQTRNIGVQTAIKAQPAKILYSTLMEYDPDIRRLMIILPGADERLGTLDYKIIPENRKAVAMDEAAARGGQR